MHLQHQSDLCHALEDGSDVAHVRDAGVGVRRGACRIQLAANDPRSARAADFGRICAVGEIERHERLEPGADRQRCDDALTVSERERGGGHRRAQVRHDDRAGEARSRERQHRPQCGPVAQVQVPVIRLAQHQIAVTCRLRSSVCQ